MKRFVTGMLMLLAAIGGWGAVGSAATTPRAELTRFVCQKALDPPARAVSVTAVMRPVTGTEHMEIRFLLQGQLTGSPSFQAIPGKELGAWRTPQDPTLGQRPGDRWKLALPVENLSAGRYRYDVEFRWLGTVSRALRTVRRTTPICVQPELRPDLLVQSLGVVAVPGRPDRDHYVVVIRNSGVTAARNFDVQFSDLGKVKDVTITRLASDGQRMLTFTGPACLSSQPPTATLDPQSKVDDYNRANNTATASCPVVASQPTARRGRPR